MEGLSLGLTGNKIGSRSCAEGANRRRDALQFLLCCGFGRRKMENDEWSSEVLGSWKSKHNSAVGSPVGPLRLHWCNITLLMSSTTPSMILLFSLSSGFSLSLSLCLPLSISSHKTKERRQQNSSSRVNVTDDGGLQSEFASTTSKNISSSTQIWLHGFFIFRFHHGPMATDIYICWFFCMSWWFAGFKIC